MVLRTFSELTDAQKKEIYDFIISFNQHNYFSSYEEMAKMFTSPVYNSGEGHFSIWDGAAVKGTIAMVTKEAETRGEIFVVGINILEADVANLGTLVEKAINYCEDVNYKSMKLGIGTNKAYLMPAVAGYGFKEVYKLHILRFKSKNSILNNIEMGSRVFENLNEANKKEFMRIHNLGFATVANGSVMDDDEVNEYISDYKNNPEFGGLYYHDGKAAGMYLLKIEDGIGWIEGISVDPELHNRGIGKILLKRSTDLLKQAGAHTIKLSVMSSNVNAHHLYLKCGFVEENIESVWYERKKYK